eukprot:TRINITY_DN4834_c0_g1_i4.p1 TRINITY_DN4834_c0_g1~~TRINITY_DN4834_c0_g1_i4.p1  ORF type:complete len:627 (-),score=251.68 TRINITY_DN4834_c0_g1_i4:21-1901(-)
MSISIPQKIPNLNDSPKKMKENEEIIDDLPSSSSQSILSKHSPSGEKGGMNWRSDSASVNKSNGNLIRGEKGLYKSPDKSLNLFNFNNSPKIKKENEPVRKKRRILTHDESEDGNRSKSSSSSEEEEQPIEDEWREIVIESDEEEEIEEGKDDEKRIISEEEEETDLRDNLSERGKSGGNVRRDVEDRSKTNGGKQLLTSKNDHLKSSSRLSEWSLEEDKQLFNQFKELSKKEENPKNLWLKISQSLEGKRNSEQCLNRMILINKSSKKLWNEKDSSFILEIAEFEEKEVIEITRKLKENFERIVWEHLEKNITTRENVSEEVLVNTVERLLSSGNWDTLTFTSIFAEVAKQLNADLSEKKNFLRTKVKEFICKREEEKYRPLIESLTNLLAKGSNPMEMGPFEMKRYSDTFGISVKEMKEKTLELMERNKREMRIEEDEEEEEEEEDDSPSDDQKDFVKKFNGRNQIKLEKEEEEDAELSGPENVQKDIGMKRKKLRKIRNQKILPMIRDLAPKVSKAKRMRFLWNNIPLREAWLSIESGRHFGRENTKDHYNRFGGWVRTHPRIACIQSIARGFLFYSKVDHFDSNHFEAVEMKEGGNEDPLRGDSCSILKLITSTRTILKRWK